MWRFTQAILTLLAVAAFAAWWWWPSPPPEVPVRSEPVEPPTTVSKPTPTPAAVQFVDLWDGAPVVGVEVRWRATVDQGESTPRTSRTTVGGRLQLRDLPPGTTLEIEGIADPWVLVPRRPHEPPLERHAVRMVQVELVWSRADDGEPVAFAAAELELSTSDELPASRQWYEGLVTLEADGEGRAVGRLPRLPGATLRISATNGGTAVVRIDPSVGSWNEDGSVWTVQCEVR